MHNYQVSGVILAGGRSTRMGSDKATTMFDGATLFQRMLSMLQGIFCRVLVAGDRPDLATPSVPCVADIYPGSSLGGLHGGLHAVETSWMFVAPCDLAFPSPGLVRFILDHREDCDAVIPRTPAGPEPLFALYHKNCLGPIGGMLARGEYRIYDLYRQVRVRYLDASIFPVDWQRALLNLNTPGDLNRVTMEES